jgi:hypothetical protein
MGLKALIRPSPKLPTRRVPLGVPKLSGADAIPHGELSGPRFTSCLIKAGSSRLVTDTFYDMVQVDRERQARAVDEQDMSPAAWNAMQDMQQNGF